MIPEDLRYTDQHEWIRIEGGVGTVGITAHAQESLGDITFVEMPEVGETRAQGDELCAIESCKAAASVYAPMGGKVAAINDAIEEHPELVNSDPYGQGWLCKIELDDPAATEGLMDAAQYAKFLGEEEH